jgi:hypothetical protein
MTTSLRSSIIRLAHANPELRPILLPLVARDVQAADGGEAPDKLPEDTWRYFKKVPGTILVPVGKLENIRARPTGIEHAKKHMWMAYNGEGGRREPITLKDEGGGKYSVQDGNSTFAVARASGWKVLPGVVGEK